MTDTTLKNTIVSDLSQELIPSGLPGGFFIYEAGGDEQILFAEENVIHIFGCKSMEDFRKFTGNTFKGMVHPDDLTNVENEIQAQTLFGEKRHDYVRYRIKTKQGEIKYIEDFGHLLHGDNGLSYFYVFIIDVDRDEYLNRSRNSYAEAQVLSMNQDTDSLTGLFNMAFFYQKVQILLSSPENRRMHIAFIHFDISNFKLFNDRYGFRLGDELLCEVAHTLHDTFSDGTVARFSDDHFVVCVVSDGNSKITDRVEHVQKQILQAEEASKRARLKAGIYYLEDTCAEAGLACAHARLSCNSIKGRHDMNYCIYDDSLRERLRKQQYVLDHIDQAIQNRDIKVFYQPVIRVKTDEICGYEALVRWVDDTMGFLSPADFIDTLEQFHLIHKLDSYVIQKVCEDYQHLKEKGAPLVPVSINLSRLDFELCDIFSVIEDTRQKYHVPMNMLDLEITESALNENSNFLKLECEHLHELGYSIWIDDFGSGYSSLNTLTEYPFDVLKLDLVFLRSYDKNKKAGALIEYIIKGALGMGISPLIEGVETKEHYEFLKKIGCERAQGYHFSKPQPIHELLAFMEDKGFRWEKV